MQSLITQKNALYIPFPNDKRLIKALLLPEKELGYTRPANLPGYFLRLSKIARVRINIEDTGFSSAFIRINSQDKMINEIMDGVCTIYDGRWEYKNNEYNLIGSEHEDSILGPSTIEKKAFHEAGLDFVNFLNQNLQEKEKLSNFAAPESLNKDTYKKLSNLIKLMAEGKKSTYKDGDKIPDLDFEARGVKVSVNDILRPEQAPGYRSPETT